MTSQRAPRSGPAWLPVAPILVFLAVNRLDGLRSAVIVATVCSVLVALDRRRRGLAFGRFMPIVTAAVLIRGAAGAITESEEVYFGLGIATKYVIMVVLLGSLVVKRPLAALGAPHVLELPANATSNKEYHNAMRDVTLIGAVYYAISASFDVWLFRRSSIEGFVVVRFLASWPLSAFAIFLALNVVSVRLGRIAGLAPVSELLERRMAEFRPQNTNQGSQPPKSPRS